MINKLVAISSKFLGLAVAVTLATHYLPPSLVSAGQGIKISPVSFDLTGSPGQKIDNIVRVSNPSDRDIAVTTDVQDFAPLGEEGGIEIKPGYQYGLSKYISVVPKSFSLKPAELQYVTVTIDLPSDLTPGARSAAVLFGSAAGLPTGSGSVVSGEIGALFVLNVPGDTRDQAKLLSVDVPGFVTKGPVGLDLRIQNTGSTVAKFQGGVKIYNVLGSQVSASTLEPKNILPQAVRRFSTAYPERDPFGVYRAEVTGNFGDQKITRTVYFLGGSPNYLGPLGILGLVLLTLLMHRRQKRP